MARNSIVQATPKTPSELNQLFRDFERIKEKVEKFTGERGDKEKTLTAIRRGELRAFASMKMNSSQVTAAPTQADYNALQKDVANIVQALQKISNILGTADVPKV